MSATMCECNVFYANYVTNLHTLHIITNYVHPFGIATPVERYDWFGILISSQNPSAHVFSSMLCAARGQSYYEFIFGCCRCFHEFRDEFFMHISRASIAICIYNIWKMWLADPFRPLHLRLRHHSSCFPLNYKKSAFHGRIENCRNAN